MKIHHCLLALAMSAALAACGGGGGSSGTPAFGSGTGTGTGTGTDTGGTVTPATYVMQLQLQTNAGVDIASNSFAASDTVKLLATLKTAAGVAAANEVVTFAETGSGLLQFTPTAATALTNASGQAMIEVKAKALESLGATTVSATATLGTTAYAASRNLAVTGAVVEGVDPQTLARAVDFVSAVPADRSIVIAGAGGNGRSETAVLQYRVVDGTGAAAPGVRVAFSTIPANTVTLNSASGITDGNGVVSASVSSKSVPTSVVVQANVINTTLATQSDMLTVTTGVAVSQRFTLAADKYVLDHSVHLDPAVITVAVGDTNGNPVADGFAVVAQATHGLVGTSGRGGCTTLDGSCTLNYRLQSNNLKNGEPIRITVSGESSSGALAGTIFLYATRVEWNELFDTAGAAVQNFQFDPGKLDLPRSRVDNNLVNFDSSSCKLLWRGFLGSAEDVAALPGTTLEVQSNSSKVAVAVSGSPVGNSFGPRTPIGLMFSLSDATVAGSTTLSFTVKSGDREQKLAATVYYPACTPAT